MSNTVPRELFEAYLLNCSEVSGLVGQKNGICFVLAAALIAFLRQWPDVRTYLLIGTSFSLLAFCGPRLADWILSATQAAGATHNYLPETVLAFFCLISMAIVGLVPVFLPVYIARKRGKTRRNVLLIALLTVLSLLLFPLWSVALFVAHRDDKVKAPDDHSA